MTSNQSTNTPKSPAIQTLTKMKELINTPDKWITGYLALNANNIPVDSSDPAACKFCLVGAWQRASTGTSSIPAFMRGDMASSQGGRELLTVLREERNWRDSVSYFNDTQGYEAVIALLDDAIALASAKEGEQS